VNEKDASHTHIYRHQMNEGEKHSEDIRYHISHHKRNVSVLPGSTYLDIQMRVCVYSQKQTIVIYLKPPKLQIKSYIDLKKISLSTFWLKI